MLMPRSVCLLPWNAHCSQRYLRDLEAAAVMHSMRLGRQVVVKHGMRHPERYGARYKPDDSIVTM